MAEQLISEKVSDRESILRFSQLADVAVVYLNLDFKVVDFNKIAEKMYNWKRKEIINQSYIAWCDQQNFIPPVSLEDVDALFSQRKVISSITNINGYSYSWNISAEFDKNDKLSEIILVGKPITELSAISKNIIGCDIGVNKSPNEHISRVSIFLENIISQLPCYVFWKDKNFVYLGCNDLTANLLSLPSRKSIIGMTDYDFGWKKEDVDVFRKIDKEIIATGIPHLNIEDTVVKSGKEVKLLVNKMPLFDENNRVIGIVGISVDITERKALEEKLMYAVQSKNSFLQSMEHDLKTPFCGVYSIIQHLVLHETDEEKKRLLNLTYQSVKDVLDILNRYLLVILIEYI